MKTEHGTFLGATNLVVPLELSCESYPPVGEIPEEALSEAEGPSTPQAGRISPTSPLSVDSPVPCGQRCDVIPVAGMSSETSSPPQSVSSRDTASTSRDQSQDVNVWVLIQTQLSMNSQLPWEYKLTKAIPGSCG